MFSRLIMVLTFYLGEVRMNSTKPQKRAGF